ncbi:MAG: PilX N-terminal domain-containing pilus assembly protein [Vicinamibacteraceae bacterium]
MSSCYLVTLSRPRDGTRLVYDRGAALILALLLTLLITVVGSALIMAVATEHLITANDRDAEELVHAADAGLERAFLELSRVAEWTDVLTGATIARVRDNTLSPRFPDGRVVSLAELTHEAQASTDREPWGANNPRWRLFVYGRLAHVVGLTLEGPPLAYVVVWVGDDHADGDGNPHRDDNDTITLRCQAYGVRHGRRTIEATVARADPYPASLSVLSWRLAE